MTQHAEYVAINEDYCVAHFAVMGGEDACEYADQYDTPCDPRPLYYLQHNDGPGGGE